MDAVYEPIQHELKEMAKDGLDALVAMSPDNVGYTAGYMIPSQTIPIRHRTFMCIVARDAKTRMIVAGAEHTYAKEMSQIKDIRPYDQFKESPAVCLAEELVALGLARGRIGLEMDFMPGEQYLTLRERLPNATFVPARATLGRARVVKTAAEIEQLRRAAKIADTARQIGVRRARAGMSELDLKRFIVDSLMEQEADNIIMVQVAAGYRSVFANPSASRKRLDPGEIVKIDVFLNCSGYISDNGKAAVVSKASELQRRTWQILNETQVSILEKVRPGVSTRELWETLVSEFEKHDMKPVITFLGHGIGLSLHEEPYVTAQSNTILEPGMVFCIEPVYAAEGNMGFHIEDEVLVTEKGCEVFTDMAASRELAIIADA